MFEKFKDYMMYLLHAPARDEQYRILFTVLGSIFDDIKETIFEVRKQSNIFTASGRYLELHGRDRNMPRLKGEDDEIYRKRLMLKAEIAKKAGTVEGIKLALAAIGYEDSDIVPYYISDKDKVWLLDGKVSLDGKKKLDAFDDDHWAEFLVLLNIDNEPTLEEFNIVKNIVRETKQASSLPIYGWRFPITNIAKNNIWFLDGEHSLNGEKDLDGVFRVRISRVWILNGRVSLDGSKNLDAIFEDELKEYWFLNGHYKLDGSKALEASL